MPGNSLTGGFEPGLENTSYFLPEQSTYANGTTVCEVEVDIETGRVHINRLVLAHDCGRVINPLIVDGQIVGGVAHGIGNALYEWMMYDDDAQPLTTNLGEYLLVTATEMPAMTTSCPRASIVAAGSDRTGRSLAPRMVTASVELAVALPSLIV